MKIRQTVNSAPAGPHCRLFSVELCVVYGDQQVSEERAEYRQQGSQLVPLQGGHLEPARDDREEGGGRTEQRHLGRASHQVPQLVKEGGVEGEGVKKAVVV